MGKKKKIKPVENLQESTEENQLARYPLYLTGLWILAAALTYWAFGYTAMKGSDLWWHIASGRFIVENRAFPITDPWSFTAAENRWIIDAWLADVIFFAWSKWFGMYALAWWKWLMVIAIFLILMRTLWRLRRNPAAAYLAAFLAAAVAAPFIDIRPHLYSLLCFSILLELTLKRKRPSWAVVPLFFVWVNLHAGFSLGFLMLPLLMFPYFLRPEERRRTIFLSAACIAVCFCNPNGYHSFTQPIIYAFDTDSAFRSINEWHPPFQPGGIKSPVYPYAIAAFILSALFSIVFNFHKKKPIPWQLLAIGMLALAMSLKSRRFITIFAVSQSLLLAPMLDFILSRVLKKIHPLVPPAVAMIIGICLLYPYPQRSYAFHYLTDEVTFPIETVNFIEQNNLSGKIFSYYNWGGYLHLRTKGRLKVYIDGRASAVFSEETYLNHVKVLSELPGWTDIVDQSGADFFLWPTSAISQVNTLLKTGYWKILYDDPNSILLVRYGCRLPDKLSATPPSGYKTMRHCVRSLNQRQYQKAEQCLKKVVEIMPENGHVYYYLALSQALQGKCDDALKTIQAGNKIFPDKERTVYFKKFIKTVGESSGN